MPEEQRKPFRSIGMRMQRFSHSLMRSYVPASEELPTVEPIAPVWQAATGVPLDWGNQSPAAPASVLSIQPPNPLSVNAVPEFPLSPAPINTPMPAAVPISPVAPTTPVPPAAPASQTIQRASASPAPAEASSYKHDPRLLAILAAHEGTDNKRETIREEKKAKIEAAEAAFDSNNQTTLQRSRRSRASFDYVETSALSKGEEQQATSKSDTPASTEANADADDEGSQPTAQAAGPPIEAPAEVTPQQPDVINRQPMPAGAQVAPETASPVPVMDAVPSAVELEPSTDNVPLINAPVQPSIDDEVLSPAPRQPSQQPTVTPSVEPASIQRSVAQNPASISAAPTTTDNVMSEVPALEPSPVSESPSDDVSPAPSVTSETSQPSPVIRRQAAPETTSKPVSPTVDAAPAADVSPAGVEDTIVEATAPIPPSVTATPPPVAPSIQRTAAPDVVQPTAPENTVASAKSVAPISAANNPPPVAPSIQRTSAPDVVQPTVPENTAVSVEPVAPTPAVNNPPPAAPSIQRTPAPDVVQPTVPENTVASAEPAANNPTPVAPSIQRTSAPDVVEPSTANTEAYTPPVPAIPSIQRSETPDTSSLPDTNVPQPTLSADIDTPTFASAPPPDAPIQRTSNSAADERGIWHTPPTVHHEVSPSLPITNAPIQPISGDPEVSSPPESGIWHKPNIQRAEMPEVTSEGMTSPEPVQPSVTEIIQRAEAPQAASEIARPQPPVTSEEMTSPEPVQPGVTEIIQRAEAPAATRPQPPAASEQAETRPTATEVIQRAEAPQSVPEVASLQSPVASEERTPSVAPSTPAPTEAIQRAEAPTVTRPQPPVVSEQVETQLTPAPTEVIQRAEAPAVAAQQSPVFSEETLSPESVQPSASEVIQRAEAPQAAPEVSSDQSPIVSEQAETRPTPTTAEVIQRVEASEVTSPQPPVASTETPSSEPIQPAASEIIQRAEASEVTSPQPSIAREQVETPSPTASEVIQRAEAPQGAPAVASEETTSFAPASPSASEVIQRAEAPQPPTSVNRPNPTPTAAEVIQPGETDVPSQPQPASTNVHEIDIFEALNAASDTFANPSSPVINRDMADPTAFIQRPPDVPETAAPTQPTAPESIQRTVDTPTSPAEVDAPIQQYDTEESSVRRAVDDELLSLLQSFKAQQSNPPPASKTSPSTSSPAPAPIVQRQSMPNVQQPVQRQEAISPPQIQRAIENESYEEPERDSNSEIDVDRLARDVYQMLQNRLRIERERRDRL